MWYLDSPGTIAEVSPVTLKVAAVTRFGKVNGTEGFENIAAPRKRGCTARAGPG